GVASCDLRLGDDPPAAAPAVARAPGKIPEAARRLAGPVALFLRFDQLDLDLGNKALVPGKAEQVIDPVRLAPAHQLIAAEAAVGAQQNARARPAAADLRDDPLDLLARSCGAIDVRAPQPGRQQVPAAEDVERQIAVAVVVAVKEPAFLVPVYRTVRAIETADRLPWRLLARLEDNRNER